ncbi:TIGR02452 family protein [Myxococcota bacterium]|nr:TIGR02452 family protein [Myxococcota bacterium]
MDRRALALATLSVIERGRYTSDGGRHVDLTDPIRRAIEGTRLFTPEALDALLDGPAPARRFGDRLRVEVTPETSQQAAQRLAAEGEDDVVLLNFASARNPGGGFLGGAKAQEEDLARCSALYPCLVTQPRYYDVNRAQTSMLYTDHVIHSPRVPFFRVENDELVDVPYFPSVITAPAPNAGELLRRDEAAERALEAALRRRAGKVLAVAEAGGHPTLLLGAWGCGVFRNDPALVADAFGEWLESPRFAGVFGRVVFAILDRSAGETTRGPFRARFS